MDGWMARSRQLVGFGAAGLLPVSVCGSCLWTALIAQAALYKVIGGSFDVRPSCFVCPVLIYTRAHAGRTLSTFCIPKPIYNAHHYRAAGSCLR